MKLNANIRKFLHPNLMKLNRKKSIRNIQALSLMKFNSNFLAAMKLQSSSIFNKINKTKFKE